jgi:predicted DNA-binding ribbon-helix-helix protein
MANNPYAFRQGPETHFLSLRIPLPFWEQLEVLAARERISMNSLVKALLDHALALDATPDGQARLHEACTAWRTRWEHKLTTRRQARAAE